MKKRRKRIISFIVALAGTVIALRSGAQSKLVVTPPLWPAFIAQPFGVKWNSLPVTPYGNAKLLYANRQTATLGGARIPADFYSQRMGFFCKKEWVFERATHIPLRFRLGSLEHCNYLEGKK